MEIDRKNRLIFRFRWVNIEFLEEKVMKTYNEHVEGECNPLDFMLAREIHKFALSHKGCVNFSVDVRKKGLIRLTGDGLDRYIVVAEHEGMKYTAYVDLDRENVLSHFEALFTISALIGELNEMAKKKDRIKRRKEKWLNFFNRFGG